MVSSEERKKEIQSPNFTVKPVEDEGHGVDSVSIAKSVLEGYTLLSGSFSTDQWNLVQKLNLGENIKQIVFTQIIHGDVYGNVTQALGSEVTFNQQVTDSFKKAYTMVEKKENITIEQKEEIMKNLKVIEEELQSKDLDKTPSSLKWLKQNASWIVQQIIQVVMEGIKIAYGT